MRYICLVGTLIGITLAPANAQTADWSLAHPDTIINYITWDGTPWTAKIQSGQFLHAPHDDFSSPQTHPDVILNYKTWDGSNWTAKLSGTSFIHAPNGDFTKSHTDSIMNYITWDGTWWTAKIQPDFSFLHAPVPNHSTTLGGTLAVAHAAPAGVHAGVPTAIPANVVQIVANQNCYFGGTEDQNQANSGSFGTVYIAKGQYYDWHVSANHKMLYWGAIAATGGPMPHMIQKGTVYGGQQLHIP